MSKYFIAVVVGSLRAESINSKLADALIALGPKDFSFRRIGIDYLPLYNQDNDENPAESVKHFKTEIVQSAGVIFITPEYNRSIPGVLKNAIDHASRPYGKSVWSGKPAGIMGASVGTTGTCMAQQHLRNILAYLNMPTLGQPEVFIHIKEDFFDSHGNLNEDSKYFLQTWMNHYVAWIKKNAEIPAT